MTIDIFVHPEHAAPSNTGYSDHNTYSRYVERMREILIKSESPLIVNGSYGGEFGAGIDKTRVLRTPSFGMHDYRQEFGEIREDEWERFKELIDTRTHEEVRIHGSYFGECTQGLARQLFAFLELGEEWAMHYTVLYTRSGRTDHVLKEFERRDKLLREHERKGSFKKSKIRYGAVLHPPCNKSISFPPRNRFTRIFSIHPHGDINFQLIDENTEIFHDRKSKHKVFMWQGIESCHV